MNDTKILKIGALVGLPSILFLVFFIVLLSCNSTGGNTSIAVAGNGFIVPIPTSSGYTVTSEYGYRLDPFGSGETKFHDGIDLAAPEGTDVVASFDGTIYEIGFSETGLGNYVYIQHFTSMGVLYTAYGHMLDDSICVEVGQVVTRGTKIGEIGSTGASTGNHVHFMIMNGVISFNEQYLIDPRYIVYGLV